MTEEEIHKGHRERLRTKLVNFPDSLTEAEILELMLFSVFKRENVNPLAHRLINAFGSLSAVLNADEQSLKSVEGVGDKTVYAIKIQRAIVERAKNVKQEKEVFSYHERKFWLINEFKNFNHEVFLLILLDAKYRILYKRFFDSDFDSKVNLSLKELAKSAIVNNAANAIICHNHGSGNPEPTEADDISTSKIYYVLMMHGCKLVDHIIVTDRETFSYNYSNRLDYVKQKYKVLN